MVHLFDWKEQNRCIAPGLTTKGRIRLRTGLSDRFPAVLCHSVRDEPH